MNELVVHTSNLPDTLKDLSKFVLVGREKLTSVRAEIRAIDKLNLAEEVRNQKKEEAQMLSEALLDAEVRLGDLLRAIPKADKGNQYTGKMVSDTAVHNQLPKHEVIKNLGFNEKQVQRFETLANNKDLVEQAKAEARENDDLPTRSRVLDLARQRKLKEQVQAEKDTNSNEYIDSCKKIAVQFSNTLSQVQSLDIDDSSLKAWSELLDTTMIESERQKADEALAKIIKIQKFLKGVKL